MTNLSEHGVRNYADCFHDHSRVGRETLRCSIMQTLEAKKRASEFELEPLREALREVESELDLVGSVAERDRTPVLPWVATAGNQACLPSQSNSRRDTLAHEAAANDDIGNIIRGLEQLIEERRHD